MPSKQFKCLNCARVFSRLCAPEIQTVVCVYCSDEAVLRIVSNDQTIVTERVNNYWNKNLKVGKKEQMQERSTEHMRKHEMHDIIAKHGIRNLVNHPLIKDGNIKKKG